MSNEANKVRDEQYCGRLTWKKFRGRFGNSELGLTVVSAQHNRKYPL